VCELPKVKCGECPNQAFIPFDDTAVVGRPSSPVVTFERFMLDGSFARKTASWMLTASRRQCRPVSPS
jgi:hypothetical protein